LFADPETAGRTVNQIGDVLQKTFKGKPVGETLGRFLGNVQIGGEGAERPRSGAAGRAQRQPQPQPAAPSETEQGDSGEEEDPDLEEILR
jgi:hypothetical protein